MAEALLALAPVFVLIVIGFGARALNVLDASAFAAANRVGYFLLMPAFLFATIASANFAGAAALKFLAGVLLGFGAMVLLALSFRLVFRSDGPAFTSFFQGTTRWNGFAILAAAPALYGPQGLALIALAFGPAVLLMNIINVAVLARWGANPVVSRRALAGQVLANPLVLACLAGFGANAIGAHTIPVLTPTLKLLGQAAMPVALICVGAGLDLKAARGRADKIGAALALKLLVAPLALWAGATAMGAPALHAAVAAGIGATPTAAAAYTLAREMGGDERLMAAIVSAGTLAAFISMPLMIGLFLP